jgi:hypothetical protein
MRKQCADEAGRFCFSFFKYVFCTVANNKDRLAVFFHPIILYRSNIELMLSVLSTFCKVKKRKGEQLEYVNKADFYYLQR